MTLLPHSPTSHSGLVRILAALTEASKAIAAELERALAVDRIETTKTGVTRTVDMSGTLARALRRLHLERKRERRQL